MYKIIITGGTGYIGSHTVVEFLESGYQVVILDNLSNSNISILEGIEKITNKKPIFYKVDVCNETEINNILQEHRDAKAVVHFAAYKAVGESVEKPLKYYQNNVGGLVNILTNMLEANIENIVFSSSCTVYGQPEILPVTEQSPIKEAMSPYGNTKQISEEIISDTVKANENLKAISLRYFNPIGAHPSALIGELPIGVPNNLLPFITQTAIGLREKLMVFGNDYNTPDGTAIRDYINVCDLAKAHLVAVERLINKRNTKNHEFFNIGTGKGISVLEIIKAFEKSTGQKLNYEITSRRAGDIEQVWADTSYAEKVLNWKAETSLEDTVKSAWEWEKSNKSVKSF